MKGPSRLPVVDALRGVAAMAVCWYHVTGGFPSYPTSAPLRASGAEGWLGVAIFFVISGFIMPHALHAAGYQVSSCWRFLAKRVVRIDVPCFTVLAAGVALSLLTGPLRIWETPPAQITLGQVLLHLGYLNYIAGSSFLNGTLWTLAIELQYYLFLMLVFPLIVAPKAPMRLFPLALLGALAFVESTPFLIFHHGYLFLIGIVTFQHRAGLVGRRMYVGLVVVLAAGGLATVGAAPAAAGVATALAIAFLPQRGSSLRFFGTISYSLYLVHIPVGLRVVAWGERHALGPVAQLAVSGAAVAASVGVAWLLWRLVEAPAQRWASAIRYRQAVPAPAAEPASNAQCA